MAQPCTRCENTGFLNIDQYTAITGKAFYDLEDPHKEVKGWIDRGKERPFWDDDVQVCDCCGNGEDWYGTPGEHYNNEDRRGHDGPYAYNGGLCECN